MTLIKCSDCSKEISKNAENCPACGAPTALKNKKQGYSFAVFTLVYSIVAILMPPILGQALIPIGFILCIATLLKRKILIGLFSLFICTAGMIAVIDAHQKLQKAVNDLNESAEQLQNLGNK